MLPKLIKKQNQQTFLKKFLKFTMMKIWWWLIVQI